MKRNDSMPRPAPSTFARLRAAACSGAALLFAPIAFAQQVVDCDTSTLASPPAYGFPLYTPGAGSTGQTVRAQWLCTDSFLAARQVAPGFVTHVGLSLAGQATYSTFVLRAGAAGSATLTNDWAANLPDQRMQVDRSGVPILGGGTAAAPVNQWVEFELAHPFHWQPGQSIVVDLTAQIAVPGTFCGTTVGAAVPRAYDFAYQGGTTATNVQATGGLVFRLRLADEALLPFGSGCPGAGNFVPQLASSGQSSLGNSNYSLAVAQALPGTFAGFAIGFSRTAFAGGALPFAYGGGCDLLVSPDAFLPVFPAGAGAGTGIASAPFLVPNWPTLRGVALFAQFAQLDAASPAVVPVVFSGGGTVVLH